MWIASQATVTQVKNEKKMKAAEDKVQSERVQRPIRPDGYEQVKRSGIPRHKTPFDDGGLSIIQSIQDDPAILLDHCREWMNHSIYCDILLVGADKIGMQKLCHRILDCANLFSESTKILSLWCDAVLKSVDPRDIHALFDYYNENLFLKAEDFINANPLHTRDTERSFELPRDFKDELMAEHERKMSTSWEVAMSAVTRIILVAELEYHRKLSRQETPDEAELVTTKQIAKLVHRAPRSLEPYREEWPTPDVPSP